MTAPAEAPRDQQDRRRIWRRTAAIAVRLALILLVVWIGWDSINKLSNVLSPRDVDGPGTAESIVEKQPGVDDLIRDIAGELDAGGNWIAEGSSVAFGTRVVDSTELESLLDTVPASGSRPIDARAELLLTQLEAAGFRRRQNGRFESHAYDAESARIRVWAERRDNETCFCGGTLAIPIDRATWQLYEMHPIDSNSEPRDQHLLPLPDGCVQRLARTTFDHRLSFELISLEKTTTQLLGMWREAGWDIERTPGSQEAEFDFLCSDEGETIRAWAPGAAPSQGLLMLVRVAH